MRRPIKNKSKKSKLLKIISVILKIDLAKTMAANMNGLQINCPKTVERSFFLSLITNRKIMN